MIRISGTTSAAIFTVLIFLFASDARGQNVPKQETAKAEKTDLQLAGDAALHSRRIQYGRQDVIALKTRLRFTTLIILPEEESILDFTCGDKEFWVVNGTKNLAYIKPAKAGSQTNLNLVTAAGNVYSFLLREVSDNKDTDADLKVFVEPREESLVSAMRGQARFVPASEIDNYREQVAIAKAEALQAREQAERKIEAETSRLASQYPASLRFDYRFAANQKPFEVTAMFHDDRFTYIRANPRELPALYEIRDGKPNLVHFDFRDGISIVSKVLDNGYLAIGKSRMRFWRKE
jgi:type IV secretory pathway VirB9-like protein